MKIGIITVHRAYNYGSVLQCYALQEFLRSLGYDTWVIDYRQRWTEAVYKPFSLYYVWHFLKRRELHPIVAYWRERKEREMSLNAARSVFEPFLKRFHLTASCRYIIPQDFDVYLIGSDQLWSHTCIGGEDKVYLADFKHPRKSKIVGYAISAGVDSLQKFGRKRLLRIIDRFDALSLRERTNEDILEKLTGKRLPVCVDPTLLMDANTWQSMVNDAWREKNYVAVYQVRHAAGQFKLLHDKAVLLAKRLGCEVVDMSAACHTVEDFVSVIKYARYVITTSFHATAFSAIMETPCYAVKLNDGLDVRYIDMLTNLGLSSELVDMDFDPKPFVVNFVEVKDKISRYRKGSIDFMQEVLSYGR